MNAKKLVRGLTYLGNVTGKKQTYHVFSGTGFFLVLSFSRSKRGAGNFNLVARPALERLRRRLRGRRGLTARAVFERSRDRRAVPSALAALNMLYVLVATGRASIDRRPASRELFFNVRKGPA